MVCSAYTCSCIYVPSKVHGWFCGIGLPSKAQLLWNWNVSIYTVHTWTLIYCGLTAVMKGRANMEKQLDTRRTSTVEKSTKPVWNFCQNKSLFITYTILIVMGEVCLLQGVGQGGWSQQTHDQHSHGTGGVGKKWKQKENILVRTH